MFERTAPSVPECVGLAGSGAAGDKCASGGQCASLDCNVNDDVCGKCAAPSDVGGPCVTIGDCKVGLTCPPNGLCTAYVDLNGACDPNHLCHNVSASCVGGKCTALGGPGAACGPGVGLCSTFALGLSCNRTTLKCGPIALNNLGQACGNVTDGSLALCGDGSKCKIDNVMFQTGTCVKAAALGEACNDNFQLAPPCEGPYRCLAGTCAFATASSCHP